MTPLALDSPRPGRLKHCAAALALLLATPALADEIPAFRKGLWEFNRTVEGQGQGGKPATMSSRKCVEPSADMRQMNAMLAKQGCKFSPTQRKGNAYSFAADCQMQGLSMKSQSVLTVESDSAYTVQVTSSGGGQATRELLKARRVGDC